MNIQRISIIGFSALLSAGLMADQIIDINSVHPVEGTGETKISGFSFQNKIVQYEVVDGLAIFEGDIVLGTDEEAKEWGLNSNHPYGRTVARSVIISGQRFRWINNLVPYQFGPRVPVGVREMVLDAIEHWEESTPIRFVERNNTNANEFPDFVNVISDSFACWSFVGRRGGQQDLNVVAECGFGATVHEFGHAIGLWHEHSREDRDQFVQINWDNIEVGKEHNFNQHIQDADDIGEYDYNSIMHYGSTAFSINGLDTITPLQPTTIGQRNGLSRLDIESIFENYPEFMPVASIEKSEYSIFLGNSLRVNGQQSFDPNGDALSYLWDLGDGNVHNSGAEVNHTYASRGKYRIELTVSDNEGNQDRANASAFVYGIEALIPAIFYPLL